MVQAAIASSAMSLTYDFFGGCGTYGAPVLGSRIGTMGSFFGAVGAGLGAAGDVAGGVVGLGGTGVDMGFSFLNGLGWIRYDPPRL